ncbi:MAG: CBS domain-containing protein [Spirochaetales bacterium]
MKLHNLLHENLILLDRPAATKEEAVRLLLRAILNHYPFQLNMDELLAAVMHRETLGGTSFPTGIAVPHARLDSLNDIVVAILRPSQPIPDPVAPVRLVVLMLTSQSKPSLYLNSLSSVLKFSQKTEPFAQVLATPHPKAVIDQIAALDYSLVKVVTVDDLMQTQAITVQPENTWGELMDVFHEHHLSYAPVVDGEGLILGEVTLSELMKAGFPDYTAQMGNLKFLKTFEPFENLLARESTSLVKDLMKPLAFSCDPSAPVVELCFELIQKGRRHCPVIKGRRLVGVVSIMDILDKVMRG